MAALGVAAVIEEYAHESLTFRDAVACEVISKWISIIKEDMDTRSSMCMLSNGFRRSSDDINIYYWKYAPGFPTGCRFRYCWVDTLRCRYRVVCQGIMMKKRRVRGHEYMTLTRKLKEDTWLKGLSAESGFELRLVAGIATCALTKVVPSFTYRFYFTTPVIVVRDDDRKPRSSMQPVTADQTLPDPFPVNNTGIYEGSTDCDIFTGEWVSDPTGPWYTNRTCNSIEQHQNCMMNGRLDSDYIYWRWSPFECELPAFDPKMFLHFMRNKAMVFIGDSISRNHVQSLFCILSQVEEPVEVYHDEEYKSKRWVFKSHNFTLSVIWSPFLTKAKIFEDNDGHSSGAVQLHLDELDPVWVNEFSNFNFIMIGGGKWFLKNSIYYENNTIIGCHNCNKANISEVSFYHAYRKAIRTVLNFISKSNHESYAFLRTTTPDHFENGEWNTGGYCNRTVPFKNGEIDMRDIDMLMRDIELEEYENAKKGMHESALRLFDTTRLSLLRPDGHPGPYRVFHPFDGNDGNAKVQNDCLHWCLPGPIDSWNDLFMNLLLRG
ncbi:trichome birefringence-like protein 25 [Tanacetum coccineum]